MADAKARTQRGWLSFNLKTLLILVTIAAIVTSWRIYIYERGTVNNWIDSILADVQADPILSDSWYLKSGMTPKANQECPVDISADEQIRLLMNATHWLPTAERRNCVLKILAEQFPGKAHDLFLTIAKNSKHAELRRNSILLASLYRIDADIPTFASLLGDQAPGVRSAAIDGIGIICEPSFPLPTGYDQMETSIIFKCEPRIDLSNLQKQIAQNGKKPILLTQTPYIWRDKETRSIPSPHIERIKELLIDDPSATVRSAAARAIVKKPAKNYQLRVAEWGVWINQGENLQLAQSIIDEIPQFVHQAGDSMASITEGRTNTIIAVTKPILHFWVEQPLAVDISVRITGGRPWFGYPKPDDFAVSGTTGQIGPPSFRAKDVPKSLQLTPLKNMREGYPWLAPSHTRQYITTVTDVGFRWQSLLVLPDKLPWMKLESVSDKKYEWWSRLREVPSSWVSNRGEVERFLYYDGPTQHPSPVAATIDQEILSWMTPAGYRATDQMNRTMLFLKVDGNSVKAFMRKGRDGGTQKINLAHADFPIQGESVANTLVDALVEKGLNQAEAEGLVDCWRPQFLETKGKRLLTIFGKEEYDKLCPISISPPPTDFARVGIVLTEFVE